MSIPLWWWLQPGWGVAASDELPSHVWLQGGQPFIAAVGDLRGERAQDIQHHCPVVAGLWNPLVLAVVLSAFSTGNIHGNIYDTI